MSNVTIKGVEINFPFEPYDLQKNYMGKVIECLQNETNGVLESPTGTGKTLSLLCASLAWLKLKKSQLQTQRQATFQNEGNDYLSELNNILQKTAATPSSRSFLGLPTIIYASRTHSQLAQAVQELKRTTYNDMKAYVMGSREQMCIHPELASETNNDTKRYMCQLKVSSRSCMYYNRVEQKKNELSLSELSVIDIEDMIKIASRHKFCPYFMTKELKQEADIIFMPYNYLLDPLTQKALGVDLSNTVVILDEAHNIESNCEDSASVELKTSDVALAIEEVTAVMKMISSETLEFTESPKDFGPEDLCVLKQMLLDFEQEMDGIKLQTDKPEGTNFDGNYIYTLLANAGINDGNSNAVIKMLSNVIQFLNVVADGPFAKRGTGLQYIVSFLSIVFLGSTNEFKQKANKCYKVHVIEEQPKKKKPDNWLSKATAKSGGRTLCYWCFSPSFGMNMFMSKGLRSLILTSGTLAPLGPLISELGIKDPVCLENPHIVTVNQICLKVISTGPDQEPLICNYQNRDNEKYIGSVGRSILNLTRVIPDGLLIFFQSYPIMLKFQQSWQQSGLWSNINEHKTIYVEPKDKVSFSGVIDEYYNKIKDVNLKGAIFMGVYRGKLAEGLDFSDANGRAVIVVGLPYPPLMDPRIILKKRYLDLCNSTNKECLKGDDWYSLEAVRAVNQAIGRVIRHRFDYGAVIFLDKRFNSFKIRNQLSAWLRGRVQVVNSFGEAIRDLKNFFRNAEAKFPVKPKSQLSDANSSTFDACNTYKKSNFDFSTSSLSSCSASQVKSEKSGEFGEVTIHKRPTKEVLDNPVKRKKINLIPNKPNPTKDVKTTLREYIAMVKNTLDPASVTNFIGALKVYNDTSDFDKFVNLVDEIFKSNHRVKHLILGLEPYIKDCHKDFFNTYCERIKQSL